MNAVCLLDAHLSNSEGHTLTLLSSGRNCPKRLCLLCHLPSIYEEGLSLFPSLWAEKIYKPSKVPILQMSRRDHYLQAPILSEVLESWPWAGPLT